MAGELEVEAVKSVRVLSCLEPGCSMHAVCFPVPGEPGAMNAPDGWYLSVADGKLRAWCPAHGGTSGG
jgi:hypothetical protein